MEITCKFHFILHVRLEMDENVNRARLIRHFVAHRTNLTAFRLCQAVRLLGKINWKLPSFEGGVGKAATERT